MLFPALHIEGKACVLHPQHRRQRPMLDLPDPLEICVLDLRLEDLGKREQNLSIRRGVLDHAGGKLSSPASLLVLLVQFDPELSPGHSLEAMRCCLLVLPLLAHAPSFSSGSST